jgi:hypothetical protein
VRPVTPFCLGHRQAPKHIEVETEVHYWFVFWWFFVAKFFCACCGLLALPADAVFCVFEDDATAGEVVANFVGTAEVAAPARFLPFVNQ